MNTYHKTIVALIALSLSLIILTIINFQAHRSELRAVERRLHPITMQLSSSSFPPNTYIPTKYTCDGTNMSPPLTISDIPADTKSMALIATDPDAPHGEFAHWVVWNIPPTATTILENELPRGANAGMNSANTTGFFGPCPPQGTHHYVFHIYALDTILDLPGTTTAATLTTVMRNHIIGRGELTGLYARK